MSGVFFHLRIPPEYVPLLLYRMILSAISASALPNQRNVPAEGRFSIRHPQEHRRNIPAGEHVWSGYPRKVIKHLRGVHGWEVRKRENGIHEASGPRTAQAKAFAYMS